MKRQNTSILLCVLALTPMAIAMPFAMDMYISTLPHIMRDFHVSDLAMQLTLNLFMIFAGLSLFFTGPLSDQIGRRRSTTLCVILFALGCLLAAFANSFAWLLAGRFVQAFGSCGLMVICLSIARDLYDGTKLAKSYSIINGIIAFSPLLAPYIGSHIDIAFGWHAVFLGLLLICLLTVVCYYPFIPETCPPEKRRPIPKALLSTYIGLFRNPTFSIYTLFSGAGISFLFLFCALSPGILLQKLHLPEADYGFYFAVSGLSIFAGSLVTANIVERLGIYRMAIAGLTTALLGGLIMLTWYLITGITVFGFVAPMLVIGLGGTIMIGSCSAGAVHAYGDQAGTANAGSSAFRLLFCGLIGLAISHFSHTPLPLIIDSLVLTILGLIMFRHFKKHLVIEY